MLLSDPIIPYELPDAANHSFFYIAQSVLPKEEAKLHRHDAWELITILKGSGTFTAGDQSQFFGPGTTALLPPGCRFHGHGAAFFCLSAGTALSVIQRTVHNNA